METRNILDNTEMIVNKRIRRDTSLLTSPITVPVSETDEAIDKLKAEGGESFFNYVDWLGLVENPNLIVLSSVHHYYFDNEELKHINAIINIKQLNLIKYIDLFFQSIFRIMPPKSNFVGCFLDKKTQYEYAIMNILSQHSVKNNIDPFENGITSRNSFVNTVYNMMDSKTDRDMSEQDVSSLLKKQGFKVLDMTELNGLTYFHSQKPGEPKN